MTGLQTQDLCKIKKIVPIDLTNTRHIFHYLQEFLFFLNYLASFEELFHFSIFSGNVTLVGFYSVFSELFSFLLHLEMCREKQKKCPTYSGSSKNFKYHGPTCQ